MSDHSHYEQLLMKKVDGVISADEQAELDAHLQTCSACRAELEDFLAIKGATDAVTQRIMQDVLANPIRPTATTRAINRLGFVALALVMVVALGWGGWEMLGDGSIPWGVRLGLALGLGAGVLVFANVLVQRLRGIRTDPYRKVDQ